VVKTLQLTTYSGKLYFVYSNHKNDYPRTRSGEMVRVAYTHVALGWIGGVLYSRVAQNHSGFRGSDGRVNICKIWFYICRVVRDPQLGIIGSNRRCSSVMET
jgi:hypothetical protein